MPRTSAVARPAIPAPTTSNRTGRLKRPPIRIASCAIRTREARVGYVRIIGYSPSVGFVLTVIVDPKEWSGVTAWKTRGTDLRDYLGNKEAGR